MLKHRIHRRARVLLAFFMVPVVLLANPQTAAAANQWHTVTISPSLPGIPDGMECTINLQFATDLKTMNLGASSYCSGSIDITPGQAQWGEDGSAWFIGVYGTDTLGPCGGNAEGTFGEHSASGVVNVAGAFSPEVIAFAATAGCNLDEVCLTLFPEPVGMDNSETCVPVDIPAPQPQQGACEYGIPASTTSKVYSRLNSAQTSYEWWWEVTVTFAARPDGSWAQWRLTGDPAKQVGVTMGDGLMFKQTQRNTLYPPNDQRFLDLAEQYRPKQVEVYALDARWNTPDLSGEWDPSSSVTATAYPPAMPDGGYRGLTQPDYCRFYFGSKLVDFPNTDADEPVGPVIEGDPPVGGGGDPVEEPTSDPITVEEPGPDTEGGFWSAVVALLKALLGLIGKLITAVKDLVLGILEGLAELFIPKRSIGSRVEGLAGVFEDRFPFNVASSLQNMGIGPGGDSGGALPVNGKVVAGESRIAGSDGCPDWKVIFTANSERGGYVFDPICESSFTSAIRGARPFILAGLLVAAFWPIVRGLFFASVPIIKPVPTDSK